GAERVADEPRVDGAVWQQATPGLELGDVLERDDGRADLAHPAHDDPGERSDLGVLERSALRAREVRAGRAEPRERDGASSGHLPRVRVPDVAAEVARLRVVGLVHRERLGVVVDRDVNPKARALDPRRGPAPAGEAVDHQAAESELQRRRSHAALRPRGLTPRSSGDVTASRTSSVPRWPRRIASQTHQPYSTLLEPPPVNCGRSGSWKIVAGMCDAKNVSREADPKNWTGSSITTSGASDLHASMNGAARENGGLLRMTS